MVYGLFSAITAHYAIAADRSTALGNVKTFKCLNTLILYLSQYLYIVGIKHKSIDGGTDKQPQPCIQDGN